MLDVGWWPQWQFVRSEKKKKRENGGSEGRVPSHHNIVLNAVPFWLSKKSL